MELSFKQIEKVFIERFAIAPDREGAFRSRLQHIQRRKIFKDLNTGRGSRASYQWNHVILLTVVLDLIDLGMSPDAAVNSVTRSKDQIVHEVRMIVLGFRSRSKFGKAIQNGRCPSGNTRFLLASASLLSSGNVDDDDSGYINILNSREFGERINNDAAVEPTAALINLGARVMFIAGLVGREVFSDSRETADNLGEWLERWANEDSAS